MVQEIVDAVLTPLRTTEAWYGIFAALAFRKLIRAAAERALSRISAMLVGEENG